MIGKNVYTVCSGNISDIENFYDAINDRTEIWHCHHRLEIQGDKVYSSDDLKEQGLYYDRPASELIFLRKKDHSKLHSPKCGWNGKNRKNVPRGFCRPDNNYGYKRKAKWLTPSGEIVYMNVGPVNRWHKDWVELL